MSTIRERNGKWQAIVRVKEHGVIIHAEAQTFLTERLAKDWATRLERKIKADGVQARKRTRSTFGDLIDSYRKAREEVKPLGRSINADLDMLQGRLGVRPLATMTPTLWTDFARKRRAEGAGPATVLHNLATARAMLNSAKAMFGIDISGDWVGEAIEALRRTGHVANSSKRDRRPTADELARLDTEFRRIEGYPSTQIRMRDVIALAVELPRRAGELCAMRWTDYNGGVIVLRDTKHPRHPRTENVPVPPKARAIIERLPRIDERILPYKSDSISASWERACIRLGIDDLHFHDLRHEGICRLFESGLQIQEVAMISGHTSWTTLKRYTHLRPQDVLEKMDAGR